MIEQLEQRLREEFAADAAQAPQRTDLAHLARSRVRARRIRYVAVTAAVAGVGSIAVGSAFILPSKPSPAPTPDSTEASAVAPLPGSSGKLPIVRADLTLEGWVSVGVLATTFDSVCETKLEATVGERANSFPITVTATSEAGVGCPVEMRHVLVKRTKLPGKVVVVDGATGRNVKLGGAFPGGEQPGYPSWPFEQAELLPDGQTIRLAFSGTPWESGPCGVEYVATARESADQVEIRLDSRMSESKSSSNPCPDVAGRRTVEVKLSQPLAGRPVFDYTGRLLNIAR